jgi:hypothetical protein
MTRTEEIRADQQKEAAMELYELIYVSVATRDMSPADVKSLLDNARQKNAQRNITGLLVYHHGEFMQLLEGDKEEIFSIYHKVSEDKRHRQVNLLWNGPIQERSFANWEMAFVGLDDLALDTTAGYSSFLKNEFSSQVLGGAPSLGKDFLLSLRNDFLRKKD